MDDKYTSTIPNLGNITTEGLSVKDIAAKNYAYIIAIGVHQYWLITLALLGFLGNSISLKIMTMVS